jgi:hypothetical protein
LIILAPIPRYHARGAKRNISGACATMFLTPTRRSKS